MPKTVRSGPGLLQQPLGGHTGNVTQTLPRFYHPFDHFFYSRRISKIVSRQDDLDARIRDFCKRIEIACADFTTRWREIEARVGPRAMAELRDIANHSLLVAVAATVASLPQTDQDRFLQTLENNADAVPRAWHRSAPLPMDLMTEPARSNVQAIARSVRVVTEFIVCFRLILSAPTDRQVLVAEPAEPLPLHALHHQAQLHLGVVGALVVPARELVDVAL